MGSFLLPLKELNWIIVSVAFLSIIGGLALIWTGALQKWEPDSPTGPLFYSPEDIQAIQSMEALMCAINTVASGERYSAPECQKYWEKDSTVPGVTDDPSDPGTLIPYIDPGPADPQDLTLTGQAVFQSGSAKTLCKRVKYYYYCGEICQPGEVIEETYDSEEECEDAKRKMTTQAFIDEEEGADADCSCSYPEIKYSHSSKLAFWKSDIFFIYKTSEAKYPGWNYRLSSTDESYFPVYGYWYNLDGSDGEKIRGMDEVYRETLFGGKDDPKGLRLIDKNDPDGFKKGIEVIKEAVTKYDHRIKVYASNDDVTLEKEDVWKLDALSQNNCECTVTNFNMPQEVTEREEWIPWYGDPYYLAYWQNFPMGEDTWTYQDSWAITGAIIVITAIPWGKGTLTAAKQASRAVLTKVSKRFAAHVTKEFVETATREAVETTIKESIEAAVNRGIISVTEKKVILKHALKENIDEAIEVMSAVTVFDVGTDAAGDLAEKYSKDVSNYIIANAKKNVGKLIDDKAYAKISKEAAGRAGAAAIRKLTATGLREQLKQLILKRIAGKEAPKTALRIIAHKGVERAVMVADSMVQARVDIIPNTVMLKRPFSDPHEFEIADEWKGRPIIVTYQKTFTKAKRPFYLASPCHMDSVDVKLISNVVCSEYSKSEDGTSLCLDPSVKTTDENCEDIDTYYEKSDESLALELEGLKLGSALKGTYLYNFPDYLSSCEELVEECMSDCGENSNIGQRGCESGKTCCSQDPANDNINHFYVPLDKDVYLRFNPNESGKGHKDNSLIVNNNGKETVLKFEYKDTGDMSSDLYGGYTSFSSNLARGEAIHANNGKELKLTLFVNEDALENGECEITDDKVKMYGDPDEFLERMACFIRLYIDGECEDNDNVCQRIMDMRSTIDLGEVYYKVSGKKKIKYTNSKNVYYGNKWVSFSPGISEQFQFGHIRFFDNNGDRSIDNFELRQPWNDKSMTLIDSDQDLDFDSYTLKNCQIPGVVVMDAEKSSETDPNYCFPDVTWGNRLLRIGGYTLTIGGSIGCLFLPGPGWVALGASFAANVVGGGMTAVGERQILWPGN
jgi:hypothetical protein